MGSAKPPRHTAFPVRNKTSPSSFFGLDSLDERHKPVTGYESPGLNMTIAYATCRYIGLYVGVYLLMSQVLRCFCRMIRIYD